MGDRELVAGDVILVAVYDGPKGRRGSGKPAGENARLQSRRVRLPSRASEIVGHRPLDASETENGFGITRGGLVPESPEVFECGIALPVKESVLQTVGLVAGESVGDVYHVPRLQPFGTTHHGNERVRLAFPCHPVIPCDIAPRQRFVTRIELRLESERVSNGIGSRAELYGHAFQCVEINPVGTDLFQKL